tara:strand:- start:638 stop:814 length:177 start_codon:yes stop_codon:yes gene_type:complete
MANRILKTNDDTRDLSIQLTDKLVELGLIPDCIDTDNEDEFETQDEIHEVINNFIGLN